MATEETSTLIAKAKQVHRAHPRCAACNRAKYKSPNKGALVKKHEPYAFCRNRDCTLFELDQSTIVRVADLLLDLGSSDGREALLKLSDGWIAARREAPSTTGALVARPDLEAKQEA